MLGNNVGLCVGGAEIVGQHQRFRSAIPKVCYDEHNIPTLTPNTNPNPNSRSLAELRNSGPVPHRDT